MDNKYDSGTLYKVWEPGVYGWTEYNNLLYEPYCNYIRIA